MTTAGSLLCPILVGRDDLLQLVERRVAQAAAGRGHLLMLAGEAGIGKSRLLGAARRTAEAAGFRVAAADLAPHDRQVPLASVLDLGRTIRGRAAFGTLGADLLDLASRQGDTSPGSRRRLVLEIADRIAGAVDAPTALVFEDLQWADELSLDVIAELARLGSERPLLLLAAYRLDELRADPGPREWRSRVLSRRLGEEARLDRLTYDETAFVTTLILGTGLPAPREVVDAVHVRTNGIPLHIEELLAALDEPARTDGRAIRDAVVPDTIEDAVLARVGRLSEEARAVARAGAVIGRCFIPEVLAGILECPVTELDAPLGELVRASILYPYDFLDQGFYDFRHQLLRDALYASVPPGEMRRLHARAGEFGRLLEGASEIHASVHFERAGMRAEAYRAALAGARAASAMSSRREAFELFGRAVANVPDGLSPLELAELYEAYGDAAYAVDDVTVAEATSRLARRYYLEAGRPIEAAMQLVLLAGLARRDVRDGEERRRPLAEAEAELAAVTDSPERSMALANLREMQAIVAIDELRLDDAVRLIRERIRIGRAVGLSDDPDLELVEAQIEVLAGRVHDGLARLLRVAREARDANRQITGVTAFRVASALAVRVMDYAVAETAVADGLRYADAVEQSYCRRILAATSAHVAWAAGRWDEAVRIAELELVERGTRRATLGSRNVIGFVAFGRGEVDRARAVLGESLAIARVGGEVDHLLPPLWGLAETALVAAEPATAVAHCAEALAVAEASGERALLVPFVVTGVRAHLAERRPDAAARYLERLRTLLEAWTWLASPAVAHAEGLVGTAAGATVTARDALEVAVRGWDGRGRSWEAAWARLDLARCLARGNRPADALDVLAGARAEATRLGSLPLVDRVDDLQRIVRGRSVDDDPWRPLTPRELEVARLIADGLTNAGIAARLAIAPKTVSAHVEHILAKLGVARRSEIAAWVATIVPAGAHVPPPPRRGRSPGAVGVGRR